MTGHQETIAGANYADGAIVPVKLSDKERKLTVGCFYWVVVRVNGTEVDSWEPARFTGLDFGHRPTWDYIGEESASGHHHVHAVEVGPVLTRPDMWLESDADLRGRLLPDSSAWSAPDIVALKTVVGAELDQLAYRYGFMRGVNAPVIVS